MIKLYGVPLSQPFRAVAWTLLQLEIPFQVKLAVPGATSKSGTLHENFRALTPHRASHVPVLKDGDLVLSESPAILMYLCEGSQHNKTSFYPPRGKDIDDPSRHTKARVDSYLHWHHGNTRNLAKIFRNMIRPHPNHTLTEQDEEEFVRILEALDTGWLGDSETSSRPQRSSSYIGQTQDPSIADILCYEELIPLAKCHLLTGIDRQYPNIHQWMLQMKQLPHHGAVHQALTTLGDLSPSSEIQTPIGDRLKGATKAGLDSIQRAVETYNLSKGVVSKE